MLKQILLITFILAVACASPVIGSKQVHAAEEAGGGAGSEVTCSEDEIETSFDLTGDGTCVPKNAGGDGENIENNPIIKMIATFVRFLSVGVGIAVTISIVIAGIQYASAQGNPQSIQAAQSRLWNSVIALLLFIFMTAIINFLVPGGVF